mgnify:CR=1 FL=1
MKEVKNQGFFATLKRGSAWLFLFETLKAASQLIITIILARLLSPSDFGVVAVALVCVSIIDSFSEFGIQTTLIQRVSKNPKILQTAWSLMFLRGVFLCVLTILIAPFVSQLLGAPEASIFIVALSFKFILIGLTSPNAWILARDFKFRQDFLYSSSGIAIRFIVMISIAYWLQNAWVIVIGALAMPMTRLVVSHVFFPLKPEFKLEWRFVAEIYSFSKWLFLSQIVHVIYRGFPIALIGRYFSLDEVGFFRIADQMGNFLVQIVRKISGRVLIPVVSQLNRENLGHKQQSLDTINIISFVILPVCVLGAFLSEEIVLVLLGEKWLSVSNTLAVLMLAGSTQALTQVLISFMIGVGDTKSEWLIRSFNVLVAGSLSLFLVVKFGALGVAISLSMGSLLSLALSIFLMSRQHKVCYKTQIYNILQSVFPSALTISALYLCDISFEFLALSLVVNAVVGIFFYFLFSLSFWWVTGLGALTLIVPVKLQDRFRPK